MTRFASVLEQLAGRQPSAMPGDVVEIPFLLPADISGEIVWSRLADDQVAFGLSRLYQGLAGVRKGYLEVLAMLPYLAFGGSSRFEARRMPTRSSA